MEILFWNNDHRIYNNKFFDKRIGVCYNWNRLTEREPSNVTKGAYDYGFVTGQ